MRDIILWQLSLVTSVGSRNLYNFDVQRTACLLHVTHVYEPKKNISAILFKCGA
jgi:hypothetical protein